MLLYTQKELKIQIFPKEHKQIPLFLCSVFQGVSLDEEQVQFLKPQ